MKTFDEKFPRQQMNTDADQRTVDFWREKQREGWKAALERILAEMKNDTFKRNMELEDFILEELEYE